MEVQGEILYRLHLEGIFYSNVQFMMIDVVYMKEIKLNFYPGILHEDDLFTVIAYLLAEKVTHIHKNLCFRRMRENSIITSSFTKEYHIRCSTCVRDLILYYKKENKDSYSGSFLE